MAHEASNGNVQREELRRLSAQQALRREYARHRVPGGTPQAT
jgi:hypothetical protein